MSKDKTKLICPECQHENEIERVYCHSCGAKLDRSAVKVQKEPVQDTRDRMKKMFDPTRARLRHLFFKTSRMILSAGAAAGVICLILPPPVPEPSKELILASQVRLDMEGVIQHRQPAQLHFTENQVDAYLASGLKSKQAALNKPLLDFKRALVTFREGSCTITVERSIFGFSLFSSGGYAVNIVEGKVSAKNISGAIGRLPIHPLGMEVLGIIFADVWSALETDTRLVSKFSGIDFHDKSATLVYAGSGQPAPVAAPAPAPPPESTPALAEPTPSAPAPATSPQ